MNSRPHPLSFMRLGAYGNWDDLRQPRGLPSSTRTSEGRPGDVRILMGCGEHHGEQRD